jgi:hypothetical protein
MRTNNYFSIPVSAMVTVLALVLFSSLALARAKDDPKQPDLSETEFKKLHAELVPPAAPWRSIPWETSMIEAQNKSVQQGKLIFIWSMDGHPLGCT